MDFDIESTI